MRLGVDVGGTFTDVVLVTDDGSYLSWKVPSTPPDFAQGLLNGVDVAAEAIGQTTQEFLGNLTELVHGTTVTTNVVLTRSGERVGLLTTRGFGTTYELARQYRGHEQDPARVSHPKPLVAPGDIAEVDERLNYRGDVVAELNERQLRDAVQDLIDRGVNSFAICYLWSFVNPMHEEITRRIIQEMAPTAYVAASFESAPVIGEYERTSTTVITAYAGPALKRYAARLEGQLRDRGFGGTLLIMKSDGGLGTVDAAVRDAGTTIYSGPAAGVSAAESLGAALNERQLITFDMGGTSTDVAIIHDGRVKTTSMQFLDRQALATSMIDITTVGAGGGSIGWKSTDGSLRVGPQSAGALPGPACFGHGGDVPTVTDALLVLGLFDPSQVLGGVVELELNRGQHVIDQLGVELEMPSPETAYGIFRVANAVMADAIRLRTVFAGLDPREFALVSFGGAGGLHCALVAAELGIRKVVVPAKASVFSALGLVSTDVTYTHSRSDQRHLGPKGAVEDGDLREFNSYLSGLAESVNLALDAHNFPPERRELSFTIELSYRGQILNFEVDVPGQLTASGLAEVVADFDGRYATVYGPGAAAPDYGYTIKTFRAKGVGRLPRLTPTASSPGAESTAVPKGTRRSITGSGPLSMADIKVFDGNSLEHGNHLDGPAIIEYSDTTVFVPVAATASVDGLGHLVILLGG